MYKFNWSVKIGTRISRTCDVYEIPGVSIRSQSAIFITRKIVFYQACVLTVHLYGFETCTSYRKYIKIWNNSINNISDQLWKSHGILTLQTRWSFDGHVSPWLRLILWNTAPVDADKLFASVGCFNRSCIENLEMANDQLVSHEIVLNNAGFFKENTLVFH